MLKKKSSSKSFHVRVMTMDAELEFDLQVRFIFRGSLMMPVCSISIPI